MSNRFAIVSATLTKELAKTYELGRSDCFLMGLAVLDAVRGTKHHADYAGRYKTLTGAHRVLRKEGHETLVELLGGILGQIAPLQASLGDLGVITLPVENSDREAEHIGVHDGRQWVVKTEEGPRRFDSAQAAAAFRV